MPKNKRGGSKHKKAKNSVTDTNIRLKEDNQEYAKVISILGNCRFNIQCSDGVERLGILRGNMRKKFVNKDDIILIEKWDDLQTDKSSIIDVYKEEHVKKLKKMNEIPSLFFIDESSECYNPFDATNDSTHNYFNVLSSEEESDGEESDIDLDEI